MVGTNKRYVRIRVLDWDQNDAALMKGRTYQQLIEEAVELRGNGAAGLAHIQGSVRKLPCICRILAAEAGEQLTIRYAFGGGPEKDWAVRGTGGGWIKESKWT